MRQALAAAVRWRYMGSNPAVDAVPTPSHGARSWTDGGHEPVTLEAGTLEDRFDREQARRHQRELRRQCDRMRLEEALGWDTDLINR